MSTRRLVRALALALPFVAAGAFSRPAEAQAYQYFAVTPCRAYDTRSANPVIAGGGAINSATVRTFLLKGHCGIPQGAAAVSLNLTITQPNAPAGDLRIAPNPGAFPNVSTINYLAGDSIANGAITPLGNPAVGQPDFQVLGAGCGASGCLSTYTYHLLIDVTGYFQ